MRILLAPLQGITTAPFRRVLHRLFPGWDGALAPFVATNTRTGPLPPSFRDLVPEVNRGAMTLEPQLLGRSGADFGRLACRLRDDYGYSQVNWNIGCPSLTVTSKGRGAGILAEPQVVDRFLDEAFGGFSGGISVKMRLGYHSDRDWEALAGVLNRYPLTEVTVHGRTADQQYSGRSNLAVFGEVLQALNAGVYYNGDITDPTSIQHIRDRFPTIKGVMVGRGAIADPAMASVFTRTAGASSLGPSDYGTNPQPNARGTPPGALRTFHDSLLEEFSAAFAVHNGPQGAGALCLGPMKEIWSHWLPWFTEGSPDPDHPRRVIRGVLKSRTIDEYQLATQRVFNRCLGPAAVAEPSP